MRENLEILSKSVQVNLFLAFKEKSFRGSYLETGRTISERKYKGIDIGKRPKQLIRCTEIIPGQPYGKLS